MRMASKQARHAQCRRLAREHGLLERGLHERLCGQVVDLVRAMGAQHLDHRGFVEQVARHELDSILQVADALEVHRARTPHHPDDVVLLREQELGEIGAVLSGDAGDERTSAMRQVYPARDAPSAKWVGNCRKNLANRSVSAVASPPIEPSWGGPSRSWPTAWRSRGVAVSHLEAGMTTPGERTIALMAGIFKVDTPPARRGTDYPAAKADRLPVVVAHHTEVELQLALFENDLRWLDHVTAAARRVGAGSMGSDVSRSARRQL